MVLIIKSKKGEAFKHNLHSLKALICDIVEEMEEAKYESEEEYSRHHARHEGRRHDTDDDYERDLARYGRGRGRY